MWKKKKREGKEKGNYCFPDFLSKFMQNVSQRTQYEAELMSTSFILIGIWVMGIAMIVVTDNWLIRITLGANLIAAFILLSSRLVTSFQQYRNYLSMVGIIEDYNQFGEIPTEEKNELGTK